MAVKNVVYPEGGVNSGREPDTAGVRSLEAGHGDYCPACWERRRR